jgi:hypothetical protein
MQDVAAVIGNGQAVEFDGGAGHSAHHTADQSSAASATASSIREPAPISTMRNAIRLRISCLFKVILQEMLCYNITGNVATDL